MYSDLPLGMLSVRDRVPDNVLKEDLEDTASLLVDKAGDTLDTTTTGETADSLEGAADGVLSRRTPAGTYANDEDIRA